MKIVRVMHQLARGGTTVDAIGFTLASSSELRKPFGACALDPHLSLACGEAPIPLRVASELRWQSKDVP